MPPEDRARDRPRKLRGQVAYAWERSPFYRRLWTDAGVGPAALESLDDLARFPFVTKDAICGPTRRNDQPFGSNLCCSARRDRAHPRDVGNDGPAHDIRHLRRTTGLGSAPRTPASCGASACGRPTPSSSRRSSASTWAAGARSPARPRSAQGSFPLRRRRAGPDGAGGRLTSTLIRPSVFYGTPSYALHLAKVARERDTDPDAFGFRIMFFSGEPGAGIPATKRRIEETFGAAAIDTGSMAEMTPVDDERRVRRALGHASLGGRRLHGDRRSRDAASRSTDGEGVPVYTHLERTSQPMIRLFSGDLARVTSGAVPLRAHLPPAARRRLRPRRRHADRPRRRTSTRTLIEDALGRVPASAPSTGSSSTARRSSTC